MSSDNTSVEFNDVRMFHQKFGMLDSATPTHLTKRKLTERIKFLQEELNEFAEGCGLDNEYHKSTESMEIVDSGADQDLAAQADALVDLVYVALGTASMMGLPWIELWEDVQRANLSKVRGVKPTRNNKVDVIKPAGWVGPKTKAILLTAGYDQALFSSPCRFSGERVIDEEKCLDDQ